MSNFHKRIRLTMHSLERVLRSLIEYECVSLECDCHIRVDIEYTVF